MAREGANIGFGETRFNKRASNAMFTCGLIARPVITEIITVRPINYGADSGVMFDGAKEPIQVRFAMVTPSGIIANETGHFKLIGICSDEIRSNFMTDLSNVFELF